MALFSLSAQLSARHPPELGSGHAVAAGMSWGVRAVFEEHRDFIYSMRVLREGADADAGAVCLSGGGDGTLLVRIRRCAHLSLP